MKVLYIMEDDFPYSGACTSILNNLLYTGNMRDSLDEVSVLTCKQPYRDKDGIVDGIKIYRYLNIKKYSTKEILNRLRHIRKNAVVLCLKKILSSISKRINKSYRDNSLIKSVYKKLIEIHADRFDLIIPVCGNFNLALGACLYKKKICNSQNIVIYQVDPCFDNMALPIKSNNERELVEKECLSIVDGIITTPILKDHIEKVIPHGSNCKVAVLEFGNVNTNVEISDRKNEIIECVFSGSIYTNIRNPKYTFELFDGLDEKVILDVIGNIDVENEMTVDLTNITFKGVYSLEETRKALMHSDFLVNIGNVMTNQVPSKIFEYISYGKPIINIYKNVNCPSLRYLERYPLVLNVFEDPNCITENREKVKKFIADNRGKHVERKIIEDLFYDCTPVFCANKMLSFFYGCTSK